MEIAGLEKRETWITLSYLSHPPTVKNYPSSNPLFVLLVGVCFMATGVGQAPDRPHLEVAGDIRPKEPFVVRVVSDKQSVTFCERLNVSVRGASGLESAPRGVEIEKLDKQKKWLPYTANLPDMGVAYSTSTIKPHEPRAFRLQVESAGDYRFIFDYLDGDATPNCPKLGKHQKRVVSRAVIVRE